ncbi:hypothetical protein ABIF68_006384 [Bradyrhizobium japonicum]
MAGTIPLSLTQQFDEFGKPLSGALLYIIQAGTVSTPQQPYQDASLTILQPNPIQLDAAGRVPQFFLADGYIKVRLDDKFGVTQLARDGVLVIGPSAGGGGGGGVDPTTLIQTGAIQPFYGTGVLAGFVRMNGRTIGSATSGASERANSDCQALFNFLWNGDSTLPVAPSRGASSAADWAANKTIGTPDARGRTLAGLGAMGSTDAGRLSLTYFGINPDQLGAASGSKSGRWRSPIFRRSRQRALSPTAPSPSATTRNSSVAAPSSPIARRAVRFRTMAQQSPPRRPHPRLPARPAAAQARRFRSRSRRCCSRSTSNCEAPCIPAISRPPPIAVTGPKPSCSPTPRAATSSTSPVAG